MKRFIKKTIYTLSKQLYDRYTPRNESIKWLLQCIIAQKILGINRDVPWPVHFSSIVKGHKNIQSVTEIVGESPWNYIDGRNGIILEENVWLGPRVSIISQNHDENQFEKYIKDKPIIIKKNCILLTNCVILPGVELGEHTIVAAGTVVTHSFPDGNQVIGGIPAKVIRKTSEYKKLTVY